MKLFKLFFRDEQTINVDAVELWEVWWTRRHGEFYRDTKPAVKVFTSKEDAEMFAKAIEDAYKLIQHTSGTEVYIKKQGG